VGVCYVGSSSKIVKRKKRDMEVDKKRLRDGTASKCSSSAGMDEMGWRKNG
jgi:hypothetical protein